MSIWVIEYQRWSDQKWMFRAAYATFEEALNALGSRSLNEFRVVEYVPAAIFKDHVLSGKDVRTRRAMDEFRWVALY